MSFNLVIRCTTHKVAAHALVGYEHLAIDFMSNLHSSHACNREIQVDNGFGPGDEWSPENEGYDLILLPKPKGLTEEEAEELELLEIDEENDDGVEMFSGQVAEREDRSRRMSELRKKAKGE